VALILALFTSGRGTALALPSGEQVIAGQASFSRAAEALSITQATDKAVINYRDFSIGSSELVSFQQPGATSVAINCVPAGPISTIAGQLSANGRIVLINPSGVVFTEGAVVDTHGLIASGLDLSNTALRDNHYVLKGGSGVVNRGSLSGGEGGVFLVGSEVRNDGTISTAGGPVGLVAGQQVLLSDDPWGHVAVQPADLTGGVQNLGRIVSEGGSVKLYGYAVNQNGVISAGSLRTDGGRVELVASSAARLGAGSATTADSARGTGGSVDVLGNEVTAEAALVSASGAAGGGSIHLGGDFHGGPALPTASATRVDAATTLRADATEAGPGGNVAVWADDTTSFAGSISTRGAGSGSGGTVEVSGRHGLEFTGRVDTGSDVGPGGLLLLDPVDQVVDAPMAAAISTNLGTTGVTLTTEGAGTDPGDITVEAPIMWSSANDLSLLAHHHVNVLADVQCDGSGDVNLIGGWNEAAGYDIATILGDPGNYGLGSGSVYIGDGTQALSISAGSRYGTTNVAGYDVGLMASDAAQAPVLLGYRANSLGSGTVTGAINVQASNDVMLDGGVYGFAYAQIGHGGLDEDTGTEPDGDFSGAITVNAGGSVWLTGGSGWLCYARIGHGGFSQDGSFSGPITVSAGGDVVLQGVGQMSPAEIGQGGFHEYFHPGEGPASTYGGDITLSAGGEVLLQGSSTEENYGGARIGNAGYGAVGDATGDISVTAGTNVSLLSGLHYDTGTQIGHGGNYITGTGAGAISVTAGGDIELTAGGGTDENGVFAQIGHGCGANNVGYDASGEITVQAGGNISLTGGGGQVSFARLGHHTSGEDPAQSSGDVNVTAANLTLTGGAGPDATAGVGHQSWAWVGSAQSGDITLDLSGNLALYGGDSQGAKAIIGHLNYVEAGTCEGAIDIQADGTTTLVDSGNGAYIGHYAAGGDALISNAPITLTTGALDMSSATGAALLGSPDDICIATTTGDAMLTGIRGGGLVSVNSAGAILGGSGDPDIAAHSVELVASGEIGDALPSDILPVGAQTAIDVWQHLDECEAAALEIDTNYLAASAGGPIAILDAAGGLEVTTVGSTTGVSVSSPDPRNDIFLCSLGGDLVVNANVTTSGDATMLLVAGDLLPWGVWGLEQDCDVILNGDLLAGGADSLAYAHACGDLVQSPASTVEAAGIDLASFGWMEISGTVQAQGGPAALWSDRGTMTVHPTASISSVGTGTADLWAENDLVFEGDVSTSDGEITVGSGAGSLTFTGTASLSTQNGYVYMLGGDVVLEHNSSVSNAGSQLTNLQAFRDMTLDGDITTGAGGIYAIANRFLSIGGNLSAAGSITLNTSPPGGLSGRYNFVVFSHEASGEEAGVSAGYITLDRAGNYTVVPEAETHGPPQPPWSGTYTVDQGGRITVEGPTRDTSISPDAQIGVFSDLDPWDDDNLEVGVFVQSSSGLSTASLSGRYNAIECFHSTTGDGGADFEGSAGYLVFDGVGNWTFHDEYNTSGDSLDTESGTYSVDSLGRLTASFDGVDLAYGMVTPDGSVAVLPHIDPSSPEESIGLTFLVKSTAVSWPSKWSFNATTFSHAVVSGPPEEFATDLGVLANGPTAGTYNWQRYADSWGGPFLRLNAAPYSVDALGRLDLSDTLGYGAASPSADFLVVPDLDPATGSDLGLGLMVKRSNNTGPPIGPDDPQGILLTDTARITSTAGPDVYLRANSGDLVISPGARVSNLSPTGRVSLSTQDGSVRVTGVTSPGRVTLDAAGSILDAGEQVTDIVAPDIELIAVTGIGQAADHLEVDGERLAATTKTGGIFIDDVAGGLEVTTVGSTTGLSVTEGDLDDIYLTTFSPLVISANVTDVGGGRIVLTASGTTEADNLTVAATLTTGGGGAVTLSAGDDVIVTGNVVTETGNVGITANGSVIIGGTVTSNGGTFTAEGGDVQILGTGAIGTQGNGQVLLVAGTQIGMGGQIETGSGDIGLTAGQRIVLAGGIVSQQGDVTLIAYSLEQAPGASIATGGSVRESIPAQQFTSNSSTAVMLAEAGGILTAQVRGQSSSPGGTVTESGGSEGQTDEEKKRKKEASSSGT
jgi:filamentous hemagglutinin family protein